MSQREAAIEGLSAVLAFCALTLVLPRAAFADAFLPPGFLWGDWVDSLAVLSFGIIAVVAALLALRQLRRISASTKPGEVDDARAGSSDSGQSS